MPKTITLDNLKSLRVHLLRDGANVQIVAEYTLGAGSLVVQTVHRDWTARLSATRRTEAQNLLQAIEQEIAAVELAVGGGPWRV